MTRKTVIWLLAAALVVAASALLPVAALRMQDARLEGEVQTQEVETVGLELLSELSMADTLDLIQNIQSRVVLERGREMTEQAAYSAAVGWLRDHFEDQCGVYLDVLTYRAVPWLAVGRNGENVVLWQVIMGGEAGDPAATMYGIVPDWADESWEFGARPFDAEALVDEHSGQMVGLRLRWTDGAAHEGEVPAATAGPAPGVMPTPEADPEEAADPAPVQELWNYDAEDAFYELGGMLAYSMYSALGAYMYPDAGSLVNDTWYLINGAGESFALTAHWELDYLEFNFWNE